MVDNTVIANNKNSMLESKPPVLQHTETSLDLSPSITDDFLTQASESYKRGDLAHAQNLLEFAKGISKNNKKSDLTLDLLTLLGRVYRDIGEHQKAEETISEALEIAEAYQNHKVQIDTLNLLASIVSIKGSDRSALELLNTALNLSNTHNFPRKKANILTNIGLVNQKLGNHSIALNNLKLAFKLYQEISPLSHDMAVNLINIGSTYVENNDLENAKQYFNKAFNLGQQLDDLQIEVSALNNLGYIHLELQEHRQALTKFVTALELNKSQQLKTQYIESLDGVGKTCTKQKNYKRAFEVQSKALKIATELNLVEPQIQALESLSQNYIALNNSEKAVPYLVKALEYAQKLQYRKKIFELHQLLATAYENLEKPVLALFHYKYFHEIEKQVFNEKSDEAIHRLTVKFDLERAERNAHEYHSQKLIAEKAAEEAERLVKVRTHELESSQIEIVMRLAQAAELRDEDTGEHTFRVGRNAAALAYSLGWAIEDVKLLYLASRLHDVGKIGISDTILLKPGKLTDDEFELMRQHTVIGARILSHGESSLLRMAERIAIAHHERWDGYGYPNKLVGNEIPICARIVSVADVLDALTHERPYKKAWAVTDALQEIKDNAGKQFDPNVAEAAALVFDVKKGISPKSTPPDWDVMLEEFDRLFSDKRNEVLNIVKSTSWS